MILTIHWKRDGGFSFHKYGGWVGHVPIPFIPLNGLFHLVKN